MTRRTFCCLYTTVLALAVTASGALHAQKPAPSTPGEPASPSLQEQLAAQYPLVKITNKAGCTVTNPETGLALQQAGIAALPANAYSTLCASHYRNGSITKVGFKCNSWLGMTKQSLVTLEKGDKVFPMKFEVGKDEVKVAFGYCSGDPGQALAYLGQVVIEFPKDSLKNASVTQVEDKIAEVFTMEGGGQQQDDSGGPGPPAPQQESEAAADTPASVEIGQTVEQVVAALGEPDTKAKGAGTKLIYVWKSKKLKVVFVNGKVSDVE